MEKENIYLLVEPSEVTPIWHANSIEGLKRSAAKQKRTVCQIGSVEELDSGPLPLAIILISTNTEWTQQAIEACRARNIRPIYIGGMPSKFGEDVSGTIYSGKMGMQKLVHYFVGCGRDRIALIGINENGTNDIAKREVFLTTVAQLGLSITQRDVYYSSTGSSNPQELFFSDIERYNGVLCSNDYDAANVLSYCYSNGIRVPEDLYVAGLGDSLLCRYTTPTLTSATRSYSQTGKQAFNIWKQLNADPSVYAIVSVVQCVIKPRGSTDYSPLPTAAVTSRSTAAKASMPEGTVTTFANAAKNLEHCLSICDQVDIRIIQGLMEEKSVEEIAAHLYIAVGTARYRLKKLYDAVDVSTKTDFVELFNRFIHNDKIFQDFEGGFHIETES